MPTLSQKKLATIVQKNGPDAFYKEKPLLAWLIDRPAYLEAILELGANPNIEFEIEPGITITTLIVCKVVLRKMRRFLNSLGPFQELCRVGSLKKYMESVLESMKLLKQYGGRPYIYRHYIRLNIH
tara:strand:- start:48 stop:425 length:378 start_codon:yes stop_codon:yes gene_type:complete